jgi:hypothetical protein
MWVRQKRCFIRSNKNTNAIFTVFSCIKNRSNGPRPEKEFSNNLNQV